MSGSGRHSKRRGGIYDGSRGVKQTQTRKKGGIMALLLAKEAGADIPIGMMRSKSVTRQFRARARRQKA
jgi:hypothetical protein